MHVTAQASYPAEPARVAAMLADPEFVAAKVRASGALGQTVDVVGSAADSFTVTTRRQMPTTGIPAQFRSLVGASLEVRQVEAWEAPDGDVRRGSVAVEVTGAPVRMTGTIELAGTPDGGSTVRYDGELKASIPLFGGAVEQATADAVRAAVAAEETTGAAWLAR